jgi:hypothetical protein
MIRNRWCVHNRLLNVNFDGKFKWTLDIITFANLIDFYKKDLKCILLTVFHSSRIFKNIHDFLNVCFLSSLGHKEIGPYDFPFVNPFIS